MLEDATTFLQYPAEICTPASGVHFRSKCYSMLITASVENRIIPTHKTDDLVVEKGTPLHSFVQTILLIIVCKIHYYSIFDSLLPFPHVISQPPVFILKPQVYILQIKKLLKYSKSSPKIYSSFHHAPKKVNPIATQLNAHFNAAVPQSKLF